MDDAGTIYRGDSATESMNELRGLARPGSKKWWDLSDGRGIMGGNKNSELQLTLCSGLDREGIWKKCLKTLLGLLIYLTTKVFKGYNLSFLALKTTP
jgi:hypothetical protein